MLAVADRGEGQVEGQAHSVSEEREFLDERPVLPFLQGSLKDISKLAQTDIYMTNELNPVKLTPELSIHITIHGFLLWASVGFLMPLGVVIIRMAEGVESIRMVKVLFNTHVTVQILALLLATVAAVLSLINFENSFNNTHQKIGLVLYGLIWIQPLIAFVKPRRGIRFRSLWYLMHWLLGTGICVLGIANIFIGLHTFHEKTLISVSLWAALFTAEVSFMAFLYLLQHRWQYVMKQGVTQDEQIAPTSHASPTSNQKEMLVMP